jgi:hypothetical protein
MEMSLMLQLTLSTYNAVLDVVFQFSGKRGAADAAVDLVFTMLK